MDQQDYNVYSDIVKQLEAMTGSRGVSISVDSDSGTQNMWSIGSQLPFNVQMQNPSYNISISLTQSKNDMLKTGLLPRSLWDSCQTGFIAKWLEGCGHAIDMRHRGDLSGDTFTCTFTLRVADMEMFEANVKKMGWDAYCQAFYTELEEELKK